ncbi:7-carboxy-7-deazaguanine synthase [Clostridium acetireducens DSM 10703]|uniref:Anaerobic ribonucleoside-triphosphate reductase-activating protein n=1 Tax=Clostridium acetireducens DSM 10703 TaxID=1121290 RepID=A0A1E8EZL0_9CLOT|nr:7-carboxy-7-deazaguanine synthase [Clostridium acetireducens DSM 10703]
MIILNIQVAGFLDNSLVNGQGLRSVLFVSGCRHNCLGCHNKEMQSFNYGDALDIDIVLDRIKRNIPIIRGVTFSGGEPFEQSEALWILAKKIKELKLSIWCYTGYTYEYIISHVSENKYWNNMLKYIDVLIDGKFEEDKKDLNIKYRGSKNQRIIDVKKSLDLGKIVTIDL